MSKKELLSESQIRRFMTLANLEPLAKGLLTEKKHTKKEEEVKEEGKKEEGKMEEAILPEESVVEEVDGEESEPASEEGDEEMELDLGDEAPEGDEMAAGGDVESAIEKIVNDVASLAELVGVKLEVSSGGDEGEGEMEAPEAPEAEKDEEDEEDEEEMDEMGAAPKQLSEDGLVEAVLARVTARLVQEAKQKSAAKSDKKPMTAKEKMEKMKKQKAKKNKLAEATSAEGGGPLLKQGKNKYDTYKGHADMAYAKGKEGKGGHQMETLPAKAEHTVTHGGKNLATLGGNKKKV